MPSPRLRSSSFLDQYRTRWCASKSQASEGLTRTRRLEPRPRSDPGCCYRKALFRAVVENSRQTGRKERRPGADFPHTAKAEPAAPEQAGTRAKVGMSASEKFCLDVR